ncbi:hypothetical protein Q4521_15405 [Saccharophagus degradans]|uniref:Uncharacterized protein n=1 Tax=Saccharophagus degradans TaxID=86304 RepID=A0AAW7X7M6_9GAMM|nr:hypothetical protein [Saccharophagus degradans]MDO6423870.1 hypothetical protein [Saccharophagus degradans]
MDEGYWSDAKISPYWTSEGGLDFSIYGCCVQYYAKEDSDSLNKVENSQISQVNSKNPSIVHKYLLWCVLKKFSVANILLTK